MTGACAARSSETQPSMELHTLYLVPYGTARRQISEAMLFPCDSTQPVHWQRLHLYASGVSLFCGARWDEGSAAPGPESSWIETRVQLIRTPLSPALARPLLTLQSIPSTLTPHHSIVPPRRKYRQHVRLWSAEPAPRPLPSATTHADIRLQMMPNRTTTRSRMTSQTTRASFLMS